MGIGDRNDGDWRDRDDLIDDLVEIITAGLALRSDEELARLIQMLETGNFAGLQTLPSRHEAVLVQVDPSASKVAVRQALDELRDWVDNQWDAARVHMNGIPLPPRRKDSGYLN